MTVGLRGAVTGLLGFALAEEQALVLACGPGSDGGSPDRWAAVPLVAHNTDFKTNRPNGITALRSGQVPPVSAEIDHGSAG